MVVTFGSRPQGESDAGEEVIKESCFFFFSESRYRKVVIILNNDIKSSSCMHT